MVVPALAAQAAGTASSATALDAVLIALNVLVLGHGGGVVLSTGVIDGAVTLSPALLLTRLARAYPSTWVYHLEDVIGASPEMLAQTEDGRVFSRVLAGSRPAADDGELDEADRRAFLSLIHI